MTLVNAALALGSLGLVIPLAIHLMFRSRARLLPWGAMHLIDTVVANHQRRWRWTQFLLLLVRCLIPVTLAWCLARPILTGFRSLPGDAPQTVVIVIDDSRSMGFASEQGETRLDRAKDAATGVMASLTRRDKVILLRSSQLDTPITRFGTDDVTAQIRSMLPQGGPVPLGQMVQAATKLASRSDHASPRVIVMSDFQDNMVGNDSLSMLRAIADSTSPQQFDPQRSGLAKPSYDFFDVRSGPGDAGRANVSVDDAFMNSPAAMVGRPVTFSAIIRNHDSQPIQDLTTNWSIDGRQYQQQSISVPPNSVAETVFQHTFKQTAASAIEVKITSNDSLPADNRRTVGVQVIDRVDVRLITESKQNVFLQSALASFNLKVTQPLDTDDADVIVMDGVSRIDASLRQRIASFVDQGGGLILFDSPDINTDLYNVPWGGGSAAMTLPGTLGAINQVKQNQQRRWDLLERNPSYAAWSLFGDVDRDLFSQVQVGRYRKLTVASAKAAAAKDLTSALGRTRENAAHSRDTESTLTLLSLPNGDPLALLSKHGQGQLVQFAITSDTRSSNFPLRPVFVPMLQQLVLDLAGADRRINRPVGQALVVDVTRLTEPAKAKFQQAALATHRYWYQVPGQPKQTAVTQTSGSRRQIRISDTAGPGVYRFGAVGGGQTIRVLQVASSESVATTVQSRRLQAAADLIDAGVFSDADRLVDANQTRRHGREIWRWFGAALVILLVLELGLQQQISRTASHSLWSGAA